MKVSKEFSFCYGHILPNHPGKCKNLHGHNSKLVVTVEGNIDPETGMVLDFGALKEVVAPLVEQLDHAFILNEFTPNWLKDGIKQNGLKNYKLVGQSTAENIATHIHSCIKSWWQGWVKVELYETPTSFVTVEG